MRHSVGRVLMLVAVWSFLMSSVGLATTETFVNKTGKSAYGITLTFSRNVTITRHDDVFPDQEPASGRSDRFTFSGGEVQNYGRFSVSWIPSTAEVVSYQWSYEPPTEIKGPLPEKQDETFQVDFGETADGTSIEADVRREIMRNQLPFTVRYEVSLPVEMPIYSLYWDLDKYVDADGDGDPTNDRDREGPVIELTYTENYNPTVTLHFVAEDGTEVASWEDIIRNDFYVGDAINIAGDKLLSLQGIDASEVIDVVWTQRHMEKMSFEYMTEYEGRINDSSALGCQLVCDYPGKYVLDAAVTMADGGTTHIPVIAWVVRDFSEKKPVGFMMADLWNEYYDK